MQIHCFYISTFETFLKMCFCFTILKYCVKYNTNKYNLATKILGPNQEL